MPFFYNTLNILGAICKDITTPIYIYTINFLDIYKQTKLHSVQEKMT